MTGGGVASGGVLAVDLRRHTGKLPQLLAFHVLLLPTSLVVLVVDIRYEAGCPVRKREQATGQVKILSGLTHSSM